MRLLREWLSCPQRELNPRGPMCPTFQVTRFGRLGHDGYFIVGRSREFRRVNSHFGCLGLGIAPRFLQKVRARPEILTNKLGLLPRREAAAAARLSKFRGLGPNFL